MGRTKSMRVMNKALKIDGISKLHLGLNISIKLNEMLIDAIVIFLAFVGRLKRLFAKTACGQKYLSQKTLQTAKKTKKILQMS